MHGDGGRGVLSAEEKGRQKAAGDADDLPPALVLEGEGNPRPAGDDDAAAATCHAGAGGSVVVPLLLGRAPAPTSAASEIEELAASLPTPGSPRPPDAAADGGLAAVAGLVGTMREMEEALDGRLRELEQAARRGGEGSKRRRKGGAEVRMLQQHLATMQGRVSGTKDAMLALRFQAEEMQALEEFWKPVVPDQRQQQQQQRDNSKGELELQEMKALEEFWKPVVPAPHQRNNSKRKINWKQIISLMMVALTSGWVPYISFWTRLPVNNLPHIIGAISVLWILCSTYSCCPWFRTSRTISRHVPRLI